MMRPPAAMTALRACDGRGAADERRSAPQTRPMMRERMRRSLRSNARGRSAGEAGVVAVVDGFVARPLRRRTH
jgi:hypothetical protein